LKSSLINYIKFIFFISVLSACINCTKEEHAKNNDHTSVNDSILIWIKKSKNKADAITIRKENLIKAYNLNKFTKNDSIKNRIILRISSEAKKIKDSFLFKQTIEESHKLSLKLKDTFSLAQHHWHKGLYFSKKESLDSTFQNYYKAFKLYESINEKTYAGRMLYGMANAQKDIRDYTGSEISNFQAISRFDKNKHQLYLYRCYNSLGVVYKELGEYKKALDQHEIALNYLQEVKNKGTRKEMSLNNIGLVYIGQKKYNDAIESFKKALKSNTLKENNIGLYAKNLDNLNYSRLLNNDTINVKQDLYRALEIRETSDYISGIVISKLHLSKYALLKKDTIKAIEYTKESLRLAKSVDNNRDYLAALKLLSEIDSKNSKKHLMNYISLNDSLQVNDRKLRNKFTRIRYQTNEISKQVDKVNSEKLMVAGMSVSIIIILLLLYFVRHQRGKNRELALEGEQQRANENIYNLLLKQQAKLEEGRMNERHRISEELHDGLLGKIFATRMRLDFLDIEGNEIIQEKYQLYLGELQGIEKEMRVISHELKNELLSSKTDYTQIVQHLITEHSKIASFKYTFEVEDTVHWSLINDVIKINCYRVIQEAIQNITKYAKATTISIHFSLNENTLQLRIKDNGVGFDTSKKKKGIGLKNITARIKKLKGTFVLTSSSGEGTILTIRIPIDELNTQDVNSN